jgi:RecA-family ATPase
MIDLKTDEGNDQNNFTPEISSLQPLHKSKNNQSINPNIDLDFLTDPKELAEFLNASAGNNGIYSAMELLNRKVEEIPCLLEPIIPKVGVCAIAGSSDTGKSSFLRQFAIYTVLGIEQFVGFKLNSIHRRAIYVSTEDDDNAISFLLNKANLTLNRTPDQYQGLQFIFETENLLEKLHSILESQKVDVIIIDCFTDLYGKSMNDTNQVRTFLNDYSQLAQLHKCVIIFLHHTGKRTDELAPSKHNLLGSQGFEAKMRLVIELKTDPFEADKRHLCIVKGNYLAKDYKTESFVLRFDENLLFTHSGERKPFGELTDNKPEAKNQVKALHAEGKTQADIAKRLGLSQSTISRYLKT